MRVKTPSGAYESRPTPSVAAEQKAIKAVHDAMAEFPGRASKSFLTGNAALSGGGTTPQGGVPVGMAAGGSWTNTGNASLNALQARISHNLNSSFQKVSRELEAQLAQQGLSWGPPFPPGRPLNPFWGIRGPARTWDFAVGENVQLTPRWNRISFKTLKALYDKYDVAQICLAPGMEIVTKRGLVPIEDVVVGDEVLTHRGRFRRVYETMANPIGDRTAYRTHAGGLEPIVTTGDHPFLAARYTHTQSRKRTMRELDWVEAHDLKPRGEQKQAPWHYDAAVLPALTFEDAEEQLNLPEVLGPGFEDDSGQLARYVEGAGRGTVVTRHRAGRLAPMRSRLPLDETFGRLLGWYLAEGSQYHDRSVVFSLSATEREDAEQIVADARRLFGAEGRIAAASAGNGINVTIHSSPMARLFACGTARTKRLPEWAWQAPREFFEAMLNAWLKGDGCIVTRPAHPGYSPRVLGVTVSKALAWQMRMIAIALGHKASVVTHDHPGRTAIIRGGAVRSDRHYTVEWGTDPQRTGRYSFEQDGRLMTTAIKTVQAVEYTNRVYNIEVEDDHSYVTVGGTVHNCVRHLIDDVRSLEVNWLPPKNCKDNVDDDIQKAEEFWAYPDRRQPFDCWLAEWLQDVLRYDAGALFLRETEAGDPYAAEIISGETIIPLIDYFGRRPADEELEEPGEIEGHVTPAFVQIIEGMPWDWLTSDQMIYQPLWPLPESQYGQCPLESILLSANTDLRFQWHFLQYFTEGTLTAGFMEAPPDLSDPAQIQAWQEHWDGLMMGDQTMLNRIRWVPAGSKFTDAKPGANTFDETFPLYLMRRTCAAYKVTPTDLGFTECYSQDTEVLTEHGFKMYTEVGEGERIATYNPETHALDYRVPEAPHVYDYSGEMIHFEGRSVDVLVTPEHDMWAWRPIQDRDAPKAWRKIKAKELVGVSRIGFVGSAEKLDGDDIESFTLPGAEARVGERGDRVIPMDLWLEFVGYMASEGCIHAQGNGGKHYNISLSQSLRANPEQTEKMTRCLKQLPINWTVIDSGRDGCRQWHVGDKALWLWLLEHVGQGSRGKRLPAFVRSLCARQRAILFEALILGDGTRDPRSQHEACDYGSMSSQLASDVQELAYGLGYRATASCDGRGFWRISIAEGRDYTINGEDNVSVVDYEGKVWCYEAPPYGLFVTRRNGRIAVHGNTVNRASSEIQVDVQARVGRGPLIQYVEGVVNLITSQRLKLRARLQIDPGGEIEDRVAVAQAHSIYIEKGVESADEVRAELGKPIDKSRPFTRFIDNTRAGPIPLLAIESQAGEVDPETYGRAQSQELVATPYSSPPGAIPPQGSPEQKAAGEHTAQAARDMVASTTGQQPLDAVAEEDPEDEDDGSAAVPAKPSPKAPKGGAAVSRETPDDETVAKAIAAVEPLGWRAVLAVIDSFESSAFAKACDLIRSGAAKCYSPEADDEPVQTPLGVKYVQMAYDLGALGDDCLKAVVAVADEPGGEAMYLYGSDQLAPIGKATATAGVTAATGIQGVDLKGMDDDDEDFETASKAAAVAVEMRRWRENARNRLKKGRPMRPFASTVLTSAEHDAVWRHLQKASSREEVDAAFAAVGKPSAGERPAFHSQADRIVEHYTPAIKLALSKLYSRQQIENAVRAAQEAKPEPTPAEKAACWDKSEAECSLRELACRGSLVKDAQLDLAYLAARKALEAGTANSSDLATALEALYGDSFLQGARDAAQAAGGTIIASLRDVAAGPAASYWDDWKPGYGQAAAQAADGAMRDLLDQAGVTIKGLTDSATERIGNAIAQGLSEGQSVPRVAQLAAEAGASTERAEVIANTEMCRASTAAAVETYAQAEAAQVEWLAEADACPECEDNADGSPYELGSAPTPPQHPNCRCALAPVVAGE